MLPRCLSVASHAASTLGSFRIVWANSDSPTEGSVFSQFSRLVDDLRSFDTSTRRVELIGKRVSGPVAGPRGEVFVHGVGEFFEGPLVRQRLPALAPVE